MIKRGNLFFSTREIFETVEQLLDDDNGPIAEGTIWKVEKEGFSYKEVTSGSYDVITRGNAKLKVLPSDLGINVKAFGSVLDYTGIIQQAVDENTSVFLPRGTYHILGTVFLPENSVIRGEAGTKIIGNMTPEYGGGFPNQMFTNKSGATNISFENIVFDLRRVGVPSFNYRVGPGYTSNPSFLFTNVDKLSFLNCTFKEFVTNKNTSAIGVEALRFGLALFDRCKNISFKNIVTHNIREETFNLYKCKNVYIENWLSDGTAVNTSSHMGAWYCEGITIKNADIQHDGGSVFNLSASHVSIEDVRVNKNGIQAGSGIDFSNEFSQEPFTVQNVRVSNCYLNVSSYGVLFSGGDHVDAPSSNIIIDNNTILVGDGIAESEGIRLYSPNNAICSNNTIVSNSTSRAVGITITSIDSGEKTENVKLIGNSIKALTGVSFSNNLNVVIDGVYIENNYFTSTAIGDTLSYGGGSVFVYIRNTILSTPSQTYSNIDILNNKCFNIQGGPIVIVQESPENFRLDRLRVVGNYFSAPENGSMDRGFFIEANGMQGSGSLVFENNELVDVKRIYLRGLKYLSMDRNILTHTTEIDQDRITLRDCSDTLFCSKWKMVGIDNTKLDLNLVASTFKHIVMENNFSEDNEGVSLWRTNQ